MVVAEYGFASSGSATTQHFATGCNRVAKETLWQHSALRDAIIDNIEELAIKSGAVIKPETVVEDPLWKGKRSIELSWKESRGLADEATRAVNKVNGMRKRMQNALVVIDKLMGMKIDGKVEDMLVDMQNSAQRALAIVVTGSQKRPYGNRLNDCNQLRACRQWR